MLFGGGLLGGLFGGGGGGGGGGSMSSGGIGNSESENTSNQSTEYNDSRMVLGQDAAYTSLTDSNKGNTSTSTINAVNSGNTFITEVDADAVGFAFDSINKTVKEAFGFGKSSLSFAQESIDSTIAFAQQAQAASHAQTQQALSFAADSQERSFTQSAGALTTAVDAVEGALKYGGTQTARAMDSLNDTANLVKDAYADAKGRGAMTDYLIGGAMLLVAFVAWRAFR